MSDLSTSLLPVSAPDLVRALDCLEDRLLSLPVEMITKDPQSVPVEYLDALAWENSVDFWRADWSEEKKRSAIAVADEVHRYKGTPYAIKKAMSFFDVTLEILEWWQPDGSGVPGTFIVRAFLGNSLVGEDRLLLGGPVVATLKAVLSASAPVSRTWDLQLGVQRAAVTYVGGYSTVQMVIKASPFTPPIPAVVAASSAAVFSTIKLIIRSETVEADVP